MTDPTRWPVTLEPREVLAALPTALAMLNTAGLLLWCNAAARRELGQAATEAGVSLSTAFESGPALADGALLQARATGRWLRVRMGDHPDGQLLALEAASDLVQAREESERCREQLNLAQDFGRLGVWRRDVSSMQGHWDDHAFALWGLPKGPHSPDYRVAMDAVLPEDRAASDEVFQESLKAPGLYSTRFRVRHSDGQIRRLHSQWQVKARPLGNSLQVIGVIIDETEAWAQASAYHRTESQLALAEESMGLARWVTDLRLQRMFYNRQASDMIGLPFRPDGMPLAEFRKSFVHPDDLAALVQAGERTIDTGETAEVETRYRLPDGSLRHVLTRRQLQRDESGAPLALIGIAIDVTGRRRADLELLRAHGRAALAARGVGLGTWEIDGESGRVIWDDQMWHLRGRQPRPMAPTQPERAAMVHPDDRTLAKAMADRAATDDGVSEYAFRVVWPDGSVHWIASRGGPVRNAAGQIMGRMGVNWDVTAARQAEAQTQARELAQQASRAKNEFLSRMSHELRTPLNAVIGFSQLLLERHAQVDDPEHQQLTAVLSGGRHLLALVNDVLELTSLDEGRVRIEQVAVDLPALVHESLSLVEAMRVSQGLAAFELDLQACAVLADPTRLRQVLINLFSNAIKYNRPGGQVRVVTRAQNEKATVSVTDTGRGLSPEQLIHLFEPFNRLGIEAQGIEGTGIGLTISKALVEHMGGTVDVHSDAGFGTCFSVVLPSAAQQPPADPAGAQPALPRRGGSVLYIEDNAVNMMLMEEILARIEGLTLHKAVDGRSGVALALQARPDLVLIDMQLPDGEGIDVLRQLQAEPATAGLRCIAVSANAMPEDIDRARRAGFIDYWTKPLDLKAVVKAVERYLTQSA